jgi:hypothetical protein
MGDFLVSAIEACTHVSDEFLMVPMKDIGAVFLATAALIKRYFFNLVKI